MTKLQNVDAISFQVTAVLHLTFKAKEINEIGLFYTEIKRNEGSTIEKLAIQLR